MNMTSTPAGKYVLKLVSSELAKRNIMFIDAQPVVLLPGTLARARVKKLVHTIMITEPTVWTEPAPILAYKLVDLDDTFKVGSCTKDDILEVLHSATGVDLKLAVAHQEPEHLAFLSQIEKLPWNAAKVTKILAALGMTVESKKQFDHLAEWASTQLPERLPVTFCSDACDTASIMSAGLVQAWGFSQAIRGVFLPQARARRKRGTSTSPAPQALGLGPRLFLAFAWGRQPPHVA
jgi:hypothetical protein